MNFRIYTMEELGEIEPDTFGYIDKEGNFWSLGKAQRNYFMFSTSSFEGMGKIVHEMALKFLNEESKNILNTNDFNRNHHLPHFWPEDKFMLGLGFCRFFRGYYDQEDNYVELSEYANANEKQLYVMNYLFALNQQYASTSMENKRKELAAALLEKSRKEEMKRALKK